MEIVSFGFEDHGLLFHAALKSAIASSRGRAPKKPRRLGRGFVQYLVEDSHFRGEKCENCAQQYLTSS
jgi:hypothetical protein